VNIFETSSTQITNQNLLNGPIDDIMDTLFIANNGRMLDTLESRIFIGPCIIVIDENKRPT